MTSTLTKKINPDFDRSVIVGYHGTSIQNAERAVHDKKLSLSNEPGDWLASGAYFWENSLDMAQRWARDRHGDNGAVVRAEIRLGCCLDLTDSKWSDAVRAAYEQVAKECQAKGIPLPKNEGHRHYLDYAVINYLCENSFSVDTVKAAFREGVELYEGGFGELSHVQIAVRNPEMIILLERSFPFPFKSYLASALTNLTEEQRKDLDKMQTIIKEVCMSRGIELYLPKEKTDPEKHKHVPAEQVFFADIEEVLRADLLILMADHPSFGGGMELKAALDALLPIILVSHVDTRVSRMVLGIPSSRSYHVKYKTHEDLKTQLGTAISFLRQNMIDRKDKLKLSVSSVASAIKTNRELLGLSKEQLAASLGTSAEAIGRLEDSPDYLTNPSILLLRKLAQGLEVSVSEIVDPGDLDFVAGEAVELFNKDEFLLRGRQSGGQPSTSEINQILRLALQERLRAARKQRASRDR